METNIYKPSRFSTLLTPFLLKHNLPHFSVAPRASQRWCPFRGNGDSQKGSWPIWLWMKTGDHRLLGWSTYKGLGFKFLIHNDSQPYPHLVSPPPEPHPTTSNHQTENSGGGGQTDHRARSCCPSPRCSRSLGSTVATGQTLWDEPGRNQGIGYPFLAPLWYHPIETGSFCSNMSNWIVNNSKEITTKTHVS